MPFLFLLILLIFLSLLLKTLLEYLAVAGAHWTIIMAVLTGIGYLVTAAVAYILLRRHYATALRSLRRFGKIEFQPGRLVWTLDVAALERYCH